MYKDDDNFCGSYFRLHSGCVCVYVGITCDHDIKNYTKYEFGYNFLLKSPFLFIISIAP